MAEAISYTPNDLCSDCKYYNFCIGNNYSEAGDPLRQPSFMVESLTYAKINLIKKGGKNNMKIKAIKKVKVPSNCTNCASRSSSH